MWKALCIISSAFYKTLNMEILFIKKIWGQPGALSWGLAYANPADFIFLCVAWDI